MPDKNFSTNIL